MTGNAACVAPSQRPSAGPFIYSAGAHGLLTDLLGLLSWILLCGLSVSVWLQSLTGMREGGQREPHPAATFATALRRAEKHADRWECP